MKVLWREKIGVDLLCLFDSKYSEDLCNILEKIASL